MEGEDEEYDEDGESLQWLEINHAHRSSVAATVAIKPRGLPNATRMARGPQSWAEVELILIAISSLLATLLLVPQRTMT